MSVRPYVRMSVRPYFGPSVRMSVCNAFSKIVIYLSGTMGQKCLKSAHLALVSTMTLSHSLTSAVSGAERSGAAPRNGAERRGVPQNGAERCAAERSGVARAVRVSE